MPCKICNKGFISRKSPSQSTASWWCRNLSNSMKRWATPCRPPRMARSQGRALTKRGPLGEGMASHASIPALRTPWTVRKGKKTWQRKMSPPGWRVSNILLGKSRGQSPVAPERRKRRGQSRTNAQLWMNLMVNVKVNQSWIFTGRNDSEAPILWPPDAKSQLIQNNPDAGKDWRQEKVTTEDEID